MPDCASEAVNFHKCLASCRIDDRVRFCRSNYRPAAPGVAALSSKRHIHIDSRFSDHAPLTINDDFTL